MTPLADSVPTESQVLWNIIDVHFDELEFALEQFERGLDHPVLTLGDLARYPEPAIEAHIDGLLVGGDEVREKVVLPGLFEASDDAGSKAVGAALVLLAAQRYDLLWPAIQHPSAAVRRAVTRAAALQPQPALDAWIHDKLSRQQQPTAQLGLLELCSARQLSPPDLTASLQSGEPHVMATAARAARFGQPGSYLPLVERLLQHHAADVRTEALITSLGWRSSPAWRHCEHVALEATEPETAALYAVLGGRKHHERLYERLHVPEKRAAVLFALGFSGNPAVLAHLLPFLRSELPLERKLAAQSISLITGVDLNANEYRVERRSPEAGTLPPAEEDLEALASLPALEDDDLEADLVPPPEELLPELDASALERHAKSSALDAERRQLAGTPFHAEQLLEYLERAAMRRRHVLARALGIMTGGAVWLDTRASSRSQRATLASLRTRGLSSVLRTYQAW